MEQEIKELNLALASFRREVVQQRLTAKNIIFAVILELLRPFSPPLLSRPIENCVMLSTVTIDYGL